jgi:hypothetical protein
MPQDRAAGSGEASRDQANAHDDAQAEARLRDDREAQASRDAASEHLAAVVEAELQADLTEAGWGL